MPSFKKVASHAHHGKTANAYEVRVDDEFIGYAYASIVTHYRRDSSRRLVTGTSHHLRWSHRPSDAPLDTTHFAGWRSGHHHTRRAAVEQLLQGLPARQRIADGLCSQCDNPGTLQGAGVSKALSPLFCEAHRAAYYSYNRGMA